MYVEQEFGAILNGGRNELIFSKTCFLDLSLDLLMWESGKKMDGNWGQGQGAGDCIYKAY